MRRVAAVVAVATGVALAPLLVQADSVLVPQVTLRQTATASYALEALPAPQAVGALQTPTWPEGCEAAGAPTVDLGPPLVWRVDFVCAEPLRPSDALYLPWPLDGARVTAVWTSGEMPARLFGRQGPGIVVSLDAIMPMATSAAAVARRHLGPAGQHTLGWAHVLLMLSLAVSLARPEVVRVLAGMTAGHAAALVLAELGAVGIPTAPSEATVALGATVLVARRAYWRHHPTELGLVGGLMGVVHGLGLATWLETDGPSASASVPALFFTLLTVDLLQWSLALAGGSTAARWFEGRERPREAVSFGLGVWSAFVGFSLVQQGIVTPVVSLAPPAVAAATAAPAGQTGPLTPTANQTTATGGLTHPLMSYLSVEPYQIRHEVLVAVDAARQWQPVSSDEGWIPVDIQDALKEAYVDLLTDGGDIRVAGDSVRPTSSRADFVTIDPNGVTVRESAVPERLDTAVIGVTLLYAVEGLPDQVELAWSLFPDDGRPVPVQITDPATTADHALTASAAGAIWRNTLGDYELPAIEAIQIAKPRLPWLSVLALGLGGALWIGAPGRRGRVRLQVAVALCVVAYLAYPYVRVSATLPLVAEAGLPGDEAAPVLEALLTNVYRAFDIHDEAAIYDRLALTVTGEQLTDVYLESRRALELENRGGATVVIDEVVVRDVAAVRAAGAGALEVQAAWTVGGSVTHFGHEHFRQNAYQAAITLAPVDDTWKIESIEILDERRVL